MKKFIAFFLGILFMAILSYVFNVGLFKHSTVVSGIKNKISVTASFYPLYFFASEIGGKYADVKNITPASAEPHDYEPTAQDIARIEKSRILILNGGKLEAWGNKIRDDLKGTNVTVVTTGDTLANQTVIEEGQSRQDPHIWLSPPLAKKEVQTILEAFIKIDSKNKDYYVSNANKLTGEIDNLDNEYKSGLASCKQKDIITSHAAFGYLASHLGLTQVPISGLSPDAEPSPRQLADIADFARKNNVKYIFFESLVSPKLSETIASEVGAKTLVLDPIEGISDDNIKAGINYLTIMKNNLKNLRLALECL